MDAPIPDKKEFLSFKTLQNKKTKAIGVSIFNRINIVDIAFSLNIVYRNIAVKLGDT
jgi:hypothetical protein